MKIYKRLAIVAIALTGLLTLLTFSAKTATAKTATAKTAKIEWLPLCGKCMKPTIFSKSGMGTEHAVAKARVTYKDAKDHCEQWSMEDHPNCDKQAKETLQEEKGKIYTATADCVNGKLTITDGENFVYAGLWPAESLQSWAKFMKGRTRWRWGPGSDEDTGKIVGFDGPTSAPMVASTAAILCPRGIAAKGR